MNHNKTEQNSQPNGANASNRVKQIEFKTRLVAPYFTEIPPEIKEKWVSGSKKAVSKTYKGYQELKSGFASRLLRCSLRGLCGVPAFPMELSLMKIPLGVAGMTHSRSLS